MNAARAADEMSGIFYLQDIKEEAVASNLNGLKLVVVPVLVVHVLYLEARQLVPVHLVVDVRTVLANE